MTNLYTLGQSAVLTVVWRDDEGALIDPVSIELTLTLPDDSSVSYVYDTDVELIRVSQGVYRVVHEVDQAGTWTWRWEATGIFADAQEGVFYAGVAVAPGDASLEEHAAEQYLFTMLTADAQVAALVGTRVYSGLAPHNATYPFVVFSLIDGFDHTTQGVRLMADLTYLVECVAEGASYPFTLAGHIDRVLRDSAGFVDAFTVNVDRISGFTLPEAAQGGKQYRRAGGRYLISVRRPT